MFVRRRKRKRQAIQKITNSGESWEPSEVIDFAFQDQDARSLARGFLPG